MAESVDPWEVVRGEATAACHEIVAINHLLADVPLQADTSRLLVVHALLRASHDHGMALVHLLSRLPDSTGASAAVLMRSQAEQFLRAVFFDRVAKDVHVQHFLEHDEVRDDEGPVGALRLGRLTAPHLAGLCGDQVNTFIASNWGRLCGFSHGGRNVVGYYVNDLNEIGCCITARDLIALCHHAVGFATYSTSVALHRAAIDAKSATRYAQELSKRSEDFVRSVLLREAATRSAPTP